MPVGRVIQWKLLSTQVCVPKDWTDEQIEEFANAENPTGIESKWTICRQGHEVLAGMDERVQCAQDVNRVHVVLHC